MPEGPALTWAQACEVDWEEGLRRVEPDGPRLRAWIVPVALSPGGGALVGYAEVMATGAAEAAEAIRRARGAGLATGATVWRPAPARALSVRPLPAFCHYESAPEKGESRG